jgi:UDP-3-O-[3-hydroxymyristoyl] glucosamine N-acyltransferase
MADCPEGKTLLLCDNPFEAYNGLVKQVAPIPTLSQAISPDVQIGENTRIDPNVVIYPNVKIGNNCHIRANVTIYENTIIGDNVTIHSGSVIGSDAFYYKNKGEYWDKWQSCGRVLIEDNVELGACCTIDRGVSGDTIIGKGSKLDNQVHVAHGVVMGTKCLIAAQVGIAGKTIIGNGVFIWGQAGISKDLHIGDGAQIMAQSGVSKDLQGGKTYFGTPVAESKDWFNEFRFIKGLPRRIQRLEEE